MSNIFDGLLFDSAAFVSYPRCQGTFLDEFKGAGCLLTNFWRAFGFNVHIERTSTELGTKTDFILTRNDGETFNIDDAIKHTNLLFEQYLPDLDLGKYYSWRMENYVETPILPTKYIISNYDEHKSEYIENVESKKAIDLIWQLIDKLPKGVQSDSHKDSEKASSCS